MRRVLSFVAAVLLLVLVPLFPVLAQSQSPSGAPDGEVANPSSTKPETVQVRVWPHKGYGRIVFDWPAAVSHSTKLSGRALSISFARPLSTKLGRIPRYLGDYATAARIGDDSRSVRLTLKPGVRFKTYASGTSVVVDLLPGKAADARGPRPAVPVRVGTHATFNRIVFDWPGPVGYTIKSRGAETVLRFTRPGFIDVGPVKRDMPPFLRAITTSGGEKAAITLRLVAGARVRHFRSGTSIVVDVLRPLGAAKSRKSVAVPRKAAGEKSVTNKPMRHAAAKSGGKVAAASGPVAVFDMEGKAVNRLARRLGTAKVAPPTPLIVAPTAIRRSAVPVILTLDPDAAVMKFHWSEAVGAAVFERAGYLWAVFDREAKFAFEGWDEALAKPSPNSKRRHEPKPAGAFIARPNASSMPGTSVFRMKIPADVHPRVSRDKSAWVVTLEREYLKPASGVNVESHLAAAAGARLFIAYADAGQAVAISDPEVGDRIWVVPLSTPDKGVGLARVYAEVELFATAQGIAGRSVRDDIVFRTLPKGIEIVARGGLTLSGMNLVAGRTGKPETGEKGLRSGQTRPGWLFDFESWRRAAHGGFVKNKHVLQRAAAMATPTTRSAARLELAQLYFAYDHLTDVLGLLQVIEQDEPELSQEAIFRALRGGAYYRLGDLDRAERDLYHASLDGFKEIALWRAALAAAREDWVTASRFFTRAETVIQIYPTKLRIHFGMLAAEAALQIGDVGLAKFHLDTLAALPRNRREAAALDFLRGRLLAKVLEAEGALTAWRKAIDGPDRRIRVLASLARVDFLLKKEKITEIEAVERLEKLRFTWRGDELEFKVLVRLGKAYMDAGDYKNGLMTLREIATHFSKYPDVDKVIDNMRVAFVKLYVDGEADKIAPLSALALYDQFRELTPQGKVGDNLISRLAERLVAVDLLDRAATLLRYLIDKRLEGTDRFDVLNRLALVYLLDRKPQQALDTLAGRVPRNIIPQLASTRRHLKARALTGLARYKEGLALVAGDKSLDAEMLRAAIYWKLRDWTNAAIAYARIVKNSVKDTIKDKNGEPVEGVLDADAQRNVLSLAISYALGRNQPALKGLRGRFLGRMAKTRFKESFDVVTAPSGNIPDDYRVISSKVAEVDQFQAFMKSYREKLLSHGKAKLQARQSVPALATGA